MLDKRSKRVLWIFGLALLGIVITELVRPQPVDWRLSYTAYDKTPMGCHVFYEEAKPFFDNKIETVNKDPYEFLIQEEMQENSAYIFVNNEIYFDDRQTEKLLAYVEKGNTIFISTNNIFGKLGDTLNTWTNSAISLREISLTPKLYSPTFAQDSSISFKKAVNESWFRSIDTLNTTALGYYEGSDKSAHKLNYVSIAHGQGSFLIHTLPEAFSNYYMLKDNSQYTAHVLSYLNADTVYWDEYIKSGRKVITSPMRFVLTQDALIWAYYVFICGLLIFVLFKGKREQRIIPIIEPLKNSSVEFTRTVGSLYFQHSDFSNIIAKKITYFLEEIRSRYYLDTQDLSEDFITKLAVKSSNNEDETRKLITFIKHLKGKSVHSEQDLIALNKKIDNFRL